MSSTKLTIGTTTIETTQQIMLPASADGTIVIAATPPAAPAAAPSVASANNDVFAYPRVVGNAHEVVVDVVQGDNDKVLFQGTCAEFYGFVAGDVFVGGNVSYKIHAVDVDNVADLGVNTTMQSSSSQNAVLYALRVTMGENDACSSKDSDYNLSYGNQMEVLGLPAQPYTNRCAVTEAQVNEQLTIRLVTNNTLAKQLKVQLLPNMQRLPSNAVWDALF